MLIYHDHYHIYLFLKDIEAEPETRHLPYSKGGLYSGANIQCFTVYKFIFSFISFLKKNLSQNKRIIGVFNYYALSFAIPFLF